MKNTTFKVNQFYNKNQFVIDWSWFVVFQSYDSVIAVLDYKNATLTLWKHFDYSKTTSKHLYLFLSDYCYLYDMNKKELQALLKKWTFTYWYSQFKIIYDNDLV